MKKDRTLLSIDAVAERMQTTKLNVLMHIKRGLLSGEEQDGRWYVAETDLQDFLTSDKRTKVKIICKSNSCAKGCGSCS